MDTTWAAVSSNALRLLMDMTTAVPAVECVPVPPFFGYHFVEALKNKGDDATLLLLPNAGHFEIISPWSDEWPTILNLFKSYK